MLFFLARKSMSVASAFVSQASDYFMNVVDFRPEEEMREDNDSRKLLDLITVNPVTPFLDYSSSETSPYRLQLPPNALSGLYLETNAVRLAIDVMLEKQLDEELEREIQTQLDTFFAAHDHELDQQLEEMFNADFANEEEIIFQRECLAGA